METALLQAETTVGNYFISNYPPYSTWTPEEIPRIEDALELPPAQGSLCLYVHIPFCQERCAYCYFRVHARPAAGDVDRYVDSLLEELSLYADRKAVRGRRLNAVYLGGGTPSYLSQAQVERLLEGLQERLSWDGVVECTFECEPSSVTAGKLKALRRLGVTRVSLGFQTLSPGALERSGRRTRSEHCLRAFRLARDAGFEEINVDLLAGLPGETEASWLETIRSTIALAPDCVSVYQLELTYNSVLRARELEGELQDLPSWPAKRRWAGKAFAELEDAGYAVASGYMAVRDPRTWRFVYTVEGFWHGADLLALGESAFGHFRGVHYQNADTLEDYTELVAGGRLPFRRAHRLTGEERFRREVILQLKTGALDEAYFRSKFGVDLREAFPSELETLRRRQLLETCVDTIRLTREGLLSVDALLPMFYLPRHQGIRYT
ncbi:MAG: coproporphyrinogen III oxidase family protein [Planctomycetes bacterium]|nr:coproporphyrinogen III oxidase family protein [Planctomycetota bacterium]